MLVDYTGIPYFNNNYSKWTPENTFHVGPWDGNAELEWADAGTRPDAAIVRVSFTLPSTVPFYNDMSLGMMVIREPFDGEGGEIHYCDEVVVQSFGQGLLPAGSYVWDLPCGGKFMKIRIYSYYYEMYVTKIELGSIDGFFWTNYRGQKETL